MPSTSPDTSSLWQPLEAAGRWVGPISWVEPRQHNACFFSHKKNTAQPSFCFEVSFFSCWCQHLLVWFCAFQYLKGTASVSVFNWQPELLVYRFLLFFGWWMLISSEQSSCPGLCMMKTCVVKWSLSYLSLCTCVLLTAHLGSGAHFRIVWRDSLPLCCLLWEFKTLMACSKPEHRALLYVLKVNDCFFMLLDGCGCFIEVLTPCTRHNYWYIQVASQFWCP